MSSEKRWVIQHELRGAPEPGLDEQIERMSPCDLLLVEGYKRYPMPKLEVYREANGKPLLHPEDPHIVAIAADVPLATKLPRFDLDDVRSDRGVHPCAKRAETMTQRPALGRRSARAGCSPGARTGGRNRRRSPTLGGDRPRARARADLDARRAAAGQHRDGRLRRARGRLCVRRGAAARRAAHSRRRRRQAARAGHRGADLHRRADSAGRGRGGAAGADCASRAITSSSSTTPQPGEWIRRAGEDIRAGATILGAGTRLRAQEIGLAASVGITHAAGLPQGEGGALLHRERARDARRAAAAGRDLQLEPLHADRAPPDARLRGRGSRHRARQRLPRRARRCAARRRRAISSSPRAACRSATRTTSSRRSTPKGASTCGASR